MSNCTLVTGGAGFIGSNFVRFLLDREPNGHVITLDSLSVGGSKSNLQGLTDPNRHTFVQGDIRNTTLVADLLERHEINSIVHLAAETHVDRSITAPDAFVQTNVIGTFQLLETARSVWKGQYDQCKFLHVSTDEVFGTLATEDAPFSESTQYAPNSPYAASKAAADHLVRAYHETYGLPTLITHCSNNFGPRQHSEKFIPRMISQALQGQPLPIYGDGRQVRDWLYVLDHCEALWLALNDARPGSRYCIGAAQEVQNIVVAEQVCALLDQLKPRSDGNSYAKLITHVADRLGHDRRYAIDASEIQRHLGWQPKMSFEEGLRATVAWYVEDGA